MIIELFGPSGAGKTTLAHAVATALQKSGCDAQWVESSRPAERAATRGESTKGFARCSTSLAAPLSRAAKLVSAVPALLSGAESGDPGANLMKLLPPPNLIWSVRHRRYLSLLCRSWNMARASDGIVIFDQGFLSALCTLFLLTRSADPKLLARGLELIPRPDLLIRLDAPREILEARLRERLRRQGAVERLFELDLETNLREIEIGRELANMLQEQGRPMTHVSCLDHCLLKRAVDKIVFEAAAKIETGEINDDLDPVRHVSGPTLRHDPHGPVVSAPKWGASPFLRTGSSSELADDAQC